jgi:hypothetical protein
MKIRVPACAFQANDPLLVHQRFSGFSNDPASVLSANESA